MLQRSSIKMDDLCWILKGLARKFPEIDAISVEDHTALRPLAVQLLDKEYISHSDPEIMILLSLCHSYFVVIFSPDLPYSNEDLMVILEHAAFQLKGLREMSSSTYKLSVYLFNFVLANDIFFLGFDHNHQGQLQRFYSSLIYKLLVVTCINVDEVVTEGVLGFLIRLISKMVSTIGIAQDCLKKMLIFLTDVHINHKNCARVVACIILKCRNCLEDLIRKLLIHGLTKNRTDKYPFIFIYVLYEICPDVLLGVINTLEGCLLSEGRKRITAVSLLMKMFSARGSSLAHDYKRLWNIFLLVCKWHADVREIQKIILQNAQSMLANQPLLRADFSELLLFYK